MPGGGEIIVGLSRGPAADAGRHAVLSVRDTGVGMDAEQQAHIFEPFFTTKAPGVGTGLGLAMVDTIVRRAGGRIAVSSGVGAGTMFTISLPAGSAQAGARTLLPVESVDAGGAMPRGAVLLVDDEAAVRNVARKILARAGFTVHACASGAEALAAVAAPHAHFDVVVTDMMMPGMTGRELIGHLAASHPALPVIVITGFTADADARAPLPSQVQRIIDKPFDAADLIGAVRRALGARSASAR
jgi:CheY-like chemotaxis protein